jgi:chromosome segregation ATPase
MHLLAISFTFLEIAIFLIAVTAFILAIRFFIASQKNLQNLLPSSNRKKFRFGIGVDREGFIVPTSKERMSTAAQKMLENNEETKHEIKELRDSLQLQQLELTRALRQIEVLNQTKEKETWHDDYDDYESEPYEDEVKYDDKELTGKNLMSEELRYQLERKETELKELRQQTELNQKLQRHFEEVQASYDELQQKVQKMEQQAWQASEIAIKVDSLEQSNEQLEKTILKKEEKIRELSVENGRLHDMLNQTEDKLSEANFQKQQLQKKTQFLQEINSDIQQMSDANRKLRNELRRVAELESMLNLITEERDALLKRRTGRL